MLEAYILEREEREGHPQTRTASVCLESLDLDALSGQDTVAVIILTIVVDKGVGFL